MRIATSISFLSNLQFAEYGTQDSLRLEDKDALEMRVVPRKSCRCGDLSFVEIRKRLALLGKRLEQRSRFPKLTVLIVKLGNSIVNFFQTNRVRVPHRASAPGRISIPIQINNIDIYRANRDAFFQDLRAFVYQSVLSALDDFFGRNRTARDACLVGNPFDQLLDFRIGYAIAVLVVSIPTGARFLSKSPELAQPIGKPGLSDAGFLEMFV